MDHGPDMTGQKRPLSVGRYIMTDFNMSLRLIGCTRDIRS
jgi:hypothetical protein